MDLIRSLAAFAVFACSLVFADAKAQIDGPTESPAGNMVVLNSVATKADAQQWIIPEALGGNYLQVGNQLGFAVGTAGKYKFGLIAVEVTGEESADIDIAFHTVTITGSLCDPGQPDKPDEPDQPPPEEPDQPTEKLRDVSYQGAVTLQDPSTAEDIARVLESIKAEAIETMAAKTTASIEAVLLNRKGESRDKDWLSEWRRPVNAEIRATTPEGRKRELDAAAAGLRDSLADSPAEPPAAEPRPETVHVTMISRDDCPHCNTWWRDVRPTLESWGWIVERKSGPGTVPRFEVITKTGEKESFILPRTIEHFQQFR